MSVLQYGLFETSFRPAGLPGDPFNANVDVIFQLDAGDVTARVPAFHDGAIYRVRFSPEIPGTWRYALAPAEGTTFEGETDGERRCAPSSARVPYWEMAPANEALSGCIREEVFCLAKLGEEYLVFMTVGQSVGLDLSHVDSPTLRCEWWNPRTGKVSEPFEQPRFRGERPRGSGGLRQPVVFTPPDYEHDWVLRVTAVPEAPGDTGVTATQHSAPQSAIASSAGE